MVFASLNCTDGKVDMELQWSGPSVIQTRIAELLAPLVEDGTISSDQADAAGAPAGGGGGGAEESARTFALEDDDDARRDFPDTAFWEAKVTTGTDGRATIDIDLPDTPRASADESGFEPPAGGFCPYCGARLDGDYVYCPKCGRQK